MADNFGRSLTIGVEEELMLLDAETLALAPGVERLLPREGLKTELFSCLVETNTPICETAQDALRELRRLRATVAEAAARDGLVVAAAGTHPFSPSEEQAIVQEPRYLKMLEEMGDAVRRQLVCGLHVHVGIASFEAALLTLEAILPWLPAVLALSVNSPYLDGADTGVLSARAGRLLELPRGGEPPAMRTRGEWEAVVAATGRDYTRSWWDARPHPRLGTLEIRIADQPTSVERAAALAALVQALCAGTVPGTVPGAVPADYGAARDAAARGDLSGGELLDRVEPAARELGTWKLVQGLREPPEAHRQLEIGRRDGVEAVAADVVRRSDAAA